MPEKIKEIIRPIKFNEKEIIILQTYFDFNKNYFWKLNDEITAELKNHDLWGPILASMSPEQIRAQNEKTYELQRAAIFEDKWEEYSNDLIEQGKIYAQMNVSYGDWYEIVRMYKVLILPHIKKDFVNSTTDVIIFMDGLSKFMDIAMYIIAESYFQEKNELIKKANKSLEKKVIERTAQLDNNIQQLNEFKHFFNNNSDLCGIANAEGYFEIINANFIKTLGYLENEFLKTPFIEVVHPDDVAATLLVYETLKAGVPCINFVNRYRKKDGSYLYLDWKATPNTLTGQLYCVARDITERKKIEVQLQAVNKELEAFTYSVSHDLRAPLRAINGFAKILHEDYASQIDADGMSSLNAIMNNSKKMGKLIDDLLAFSRLGRTEIITSEINMTALVKSIKEEETIWNSSELEFIIHELLTAKGSQVLIKQVWANLISNAIKYSKNKPKIKIEIGSYYKGNHVVYYVKDNGAGFEMQYYNKLFKVFHRLHSSEEFEGTGVGLAIVQKIIHQHNGTIWAESKLDEETCFYFSLPANQTN